MSTIVLVHGAWHTGWCWHKVIPYLQQFGHHVVAPDLPGHGNTEYNPSSVTLQDYTDHIRAIVEQQPEPVMLVGHSMSGIVISQVGEAVPGKVAGLVYLTAFLLRDGESMLEVTQADKEGLVLPNLEFSRDRRTATVRDDIVQDAFYNDCGDVDVLLAKSHLVPQPLAPIATAIHVTREIWGRIPRSFIECTGDRAVSLNVQKQMHANLPCEQVLTMKTGHSPFLSAARDLAVNLDHLSAFEP